MQHSQLPGEAAQVVHPVVELRLALLPRQRRGQRAGAQLQVHRRRREVAVACARALGGKEGLVACACMLEGAANHPDPSHILFFLNKDPPAVPTFASTPPWNAAHTRAAQACSPSKP